jgi:hypothetical protein
LAGNYIDETERWHMESLLLNNMGCFYKKMQKPNVALKFMRHALKVDEEWGNSTNNTATTRLNICAILS